ncbi:MAG: hypothetical protein IKM30_00600 [Oscillospiraceae bacterium]|nr:hypothetical protein [Oscillospiraceae bacterium]
MDATVFPISFHQHLIFCGIAILFFVLQFIRLRYWYQLVMVTAIAASLLVYVNENSVWFYSVGILELLLLITAFVLYRKQTKKLAAAEAAEAAAQESTANEEQNAESAAVMDESASEESEEQTETESET